MILRKKIVKIVVVFLVLAALASFLRFFYLIEPFDNDEYSSQDSSPTWYNILNQLMKDKNYTYEVEIENKNYFYKISKNVKKKIKKYVKGLTKYITYSDFCEHVGNNILNTGEWDWSSIEYGSLPGASNAAADEDVIDQKKKSAKQMLIQYYRDNMMGDSSSKSITGGFHKINNQGAYSIDNKNTKTNLMMFDIKEWAKQK